MTELPKYVQKDLKILHNYEFSTDQWGREINQDDKMAYKLYQIAKKYPQRYLHEILEYLGYFCDYYEELKEEDFRAEIFHMAEYYFQKAMEDHFLMYSYQEEIEEEDYHRFNRQIKFINIGWLDCVYTDRKSYLEHYKDVERYPSQVVYIDKEW